MSLNRKTLNSLLRIWQLARGVTGTEINRLQQADAPLSVAGSEENRSRIIGRLGPGAEGSVSQHASVEEARKAGFRLVLDSDMIAAHGEASFTAALSDIARAHKDKRIALAARYPAFRPVVVDRLTSEYAQTNARLAAVSALPGIVPAFDWLLPVTAAGDMIVLTRNQIALMLEIASCYDLPPDPRARLAELLPVVGGAFGWRAAAREIVGLVPGGVGVAAKAAISYAGTYAVGKAAGYYYATGRKLDISKTFRSALTRTLTTGKRIITRRQLAETAS